MRFLVTTSRAIEKRVGSSTTRNHCQSMKWHESGQIQALDRTAPRLPLLPTTPARMTHDYVRQGTTSLFAAMDVASGPVIA